MSDKDKIDTLTRCFIDVVWMSIRYAHGRNTYAPSTVREAVKDFQRIYPDWKPSWDSTIETPTELPSVSLKADYLHDILKDK